MQSIFSFQRQVRKWNSVVFKFFLSSALLVVMTPLTVAAGVLSTTRAAQGTITLYGTTAGDPLVDNIGAPVVTNVAISDLQQFQVSGTGKIYDPVSPGSASYAGGLFGAVSPNAAHLGITDGSFLRVTAGNSSRVVSVDFSASVGLRHDSFIPGVGLDLSPLHVSTYYHVSGYLAPGDSIAFTSISGMVQRTSSPNGGVPIPAQLYGNQFFTTPGSFEWTFSDTVSFVPQAFFDNFDLLLFARLQITSQGGQTSWITIDPGVGVSDNQSQEYPWTPVAAVPEPIGMVQLGIATCCFVGYLALRRLLIDRTET